MTRRLSARIVARGVAALDLVARGFSQYRNVDGLFSSRNTRILSFAQPENRSMAEYNSLFSGFGSLRFTPRVVVSILLLTGSGRFCRDRPRCADSRSSDQPGLPADHRAIDSLESGGAGGRCSMGHRRCWGPITWLAFLIRFDVRKVKRGNSATSSG